MAVRYEAVRTYITTRNAPDGSVVDFIWNYVRFGKLRERRADAITDGFDAWGHDDFNSAVWEGERLLSWDWMDEVVDDEESELVRLGRRLVGGDS